jgi:hypothetical protein
MATRTAHDSICLPHARQQLRSAGAQLHLPLASAWAPAAPPEMLATCRRPDMAPMLLRAFATAMPAAYVTCGNSQIPHSDLAALVLAASIETPNDHPLKRWRLGEAGRMMHDACCMFCLAPAWRS